MFLTVILSLVIAAAGAAISLYAGPLGEAATFALFAGATLLAAFGSTMLPGSPQQQAETGKKKPAPRKAKSTGSGGRRQGTIKWFNVSKGFGFITADDGEEVFVHFKSIQGSNRRDVRQGASVSFLVGQSAKGPQAEDVEVSGD